MRRFTVWSPKDFIILGADWFLDGARDLAHDLDVSALVVGVLLAGAERTHGWNRKTPSQEKVKAKRLFSPFYGFWIGWVYLIYPPMQTLGTATLIYALATIAARLLLWVVPVFLYLRSIDHVNPVAYLKLNRYWKRGLFIGLVLSLLNFLGMLLRFGLPHLSIQYVTWNSILSTSTLIGFFEEIPFRGFIFQKLQEKFHFWISNILSSLLFLGIHLPGWILLHALTWSNVISIFVLGVIFTVIFYFSKTLWSSIITHSLNDFLSAVLFHIS